MKSKKMLAEIAAFSLVFGMTGVVSSWADNTADEVVVKGTMVEQYDPFKCEKVDNTLVDTAADGSLSITGKDVRGIWLTDGAKLTANNVNFNDKGTANEVCAENGSTLIVNGGSIKAPMGYFSADSGSTISTDKTTITTGAFANNAAITLKNSTISGNWLYAGNAFPEDENDKGDVAEGLPVGSITIDGGTASVKNVLVQNKGQFMVTNGAVLDVTKDTSAIDSEIEQSATGIKKGGEIIVRAWGPNTAWAEKENNDTITNLKQVSTLAVNGATVKANKLTVEGKEAKKLNYSESAAFTAKNNSAVVLDSAVLNRAKFYAENSQISIGDLHADNNSQFLANNGTKAEIQKMTMDNGSVLGVGSYGKVADVTVHQLDMKGNSTIAIENGQLNSDQITMDESTIGIAGVGTLIANKMTLNNTTLSLSGIQNKAATLALDADEDIQPLDVTQNGVTVEVKDTLDMNGGTLQVNAGSKLITNQMKLANESKVNVVGPGSSYTINGKENVMSGNAKIAATNGGSVTLAEGAGIKTEADANNKVKTIITADAGSTVDVTKGSLYIANAKRDGTVYDVSTAVKSGTENKGNAFDKIYGNSRRTIAIKKDANGNYTFKSNIDEIAKNSPIYNILNEADQNEGKLAQFAEFMDKALGEGTLGEGMTEAQQNALANNALEHAAAIAEMAGVTHGTYGFAQDFSGMIANHKGEGNGIWANYLRQDKKVDGFQVAGRKAKYDVKYNGFLIGSDLISDENSRTGIAFAYADGSHTEKDGVIGTNDTKYYGGDVYHHFTAGGIQYKADIGFIKSDNDLEQTQLGTTIKGSVDGNAFFAGIRAEKEIALGASSLTPYAGLRYYRIHTGDFTDSLGMKHETENANLWNLPVGVEFRHEVKNGNWSLTPVAEIGYNFAMGDKDTKETVSLGNAADTFSFDIGESAFLARLGVEAENSTWTLGGGYRYQKGSDTQSNQWYIQAGYRF
mgnify:CR=1 FL=1